MSEIKTFDALALIQKNLADQLSRYPEGSLAAREIIQTLPIKGDQEKFFQQTNMKITKAILTKAEEISKQQLSDRVKTSEWSKKNNEALSKLVVSSLK